MYFFCFARHVSLEKHYIYYTIKQERDGLILWIVIAYQFDTH